MKLYHQTSPEICHLILASAFKLGHEGWCGGAIYFAATPQATKTKAVGPQSHYGCMIEATVNVGKIQHFPCCRYCGGKQDQHIHWTLQSLNAKGYNSINIDPGDGPEYIIYDPAQVVSMKEIPFNEAWRPTTSYR